MILYKDQEIWTHHGLIFISGMGAHVKKTVSSRKDLRPHTSDRAPISGALRNDSRPWKKNKKTKHVRTLCYGQQCNNLEYTVKYTKVLKNNYITEFLVIFISSH